MDERNRLAGAGGGRSRSAGRAAQRRHVLFDGKSLSQWEGGEKWPVRDGYAITAVSHIATKRAFGDCQLHVEWATPQKSPATARTAATAASS